MREMRLSKREITDAAELRNILEECQVFRIGLEDEEGIFIVPLNYGFEMEERESKPPILTLYFHSAVAGRKSDALAKEPRVAIELDCGHELITGDYSCAYSYAYRSIMGSGRVHLLQDKEEKIHGLDLLLEHTHASKMAQYHDDALARTNVYRIDVEYFTGKQRVKK